MAFVFRISFFSFELVRLGVIIHTLELYVCAMHVECEHSQNDNWYIVYIQSIWCKRRCMHTVENFNDTVCVYINLLASLSKFYILLGMGESDMLRWERWCVNVCAKLNLTKITYQYIMSK